MGIAATAGAAFCAGCGGPWMSKGPHARQAVQTIPPNPVSKRMLRIGLIGAGIQGSRDRRAIEAAGDRVVAMCDVDSSALVSKGDTHVYKDFRVMLEAEPKLDALFIATPDHGHAIQISWALSRGIPVFAEPPVTRTLGELRAVSRQAEHAGVPLWQGVQNRTERAFRRAVNCLEQGVIGKVSEVHAWTSAPLWPQGVPRPAGSDPVPETFDWDLWLGPAPLRPYKGGVYHPVAWRGWTDFGTGALGDTGPHLLNLPFQFLQVPAPETVELLTAPADSDSYAKASHVRFTFPVPPHSQTPVTLDWYDGSLLPQIPQAERIKPAFGGELPAEGCLLIGELGVWLMAGADGRKHFLKRFNDAEPIPMEQHKACAAIPEPQETISLQRAFLDMIRLDRGSLARTNISLPQMETILTGCVAQRVGGRLEWLSGRGAFKENLVADALVAPPPRAGWEYRT
jgi:predicted dehydrogenase